MYKTHRRGNNTAWYSLSFTYQITKFHQSRWRITEYEQGIRMFLHRQTYTGLCTGDPFFRCHCCYPFIGTPSVRQLRTLLRR